MSGEPIGEVELECGAVAKVGAAGVVDLWFSTRDGRHLERTAVALTAAEITKLVALLQLGSHVAPAIARAQETCRTTVMAAEAQYERFVAELIGGAR